MKDKHGREIQAGDTLVTTNPYQPTTYDVQGFNCLGEAVMTRRYRDGVERPWILFFLNKDFSCLCYEVKE